MPRLTLENILAICDANLFEIQLAIADLISMENIKEEIDGQDAYLLITEKGKLAVEPLKKDVPSSVRETAITRALVEMAQLRQAIAVEAEVVPVTTPYEQYYTCKLALKEDNRTMLRLELFTPTKIHAERIAKNFRGNPNDIYTQIIKILTQKY